MVACPHSRPDSEGSGGNLALEQAQVSYISSPRFEPIRTSVPADLAPASGDFGKAGIGPPQPPLPNAGTPQKPPPGSGRWCRLEASRSGPSPAMSPTSSISGPCSPAGCTMTRSTRPPQEFDLLGARVVSRESFMPRAAQNRLVDQPERPDRA